MKKLSLTSGFLALILLTACSQAASTSQIPTSIPVAPTEQSQIPASIPVDTQEKAQVKVTVPTASTSTTTTTKTTPPTKTTSPTPTPAPTATTTPTATTPPVTPVVNTPKTVTFSVSGGSFFFTPNTMKVKKGDTVKIVFTNAGGMHNLILDAFGVATRTLSTGETQTVEFTADKSGSFEYYCGVGSHRAMGQKGTLTVE